MGLFIGLRGITSPSFPLSDFRATVFRGKKESCQKTNATALVDSIVAIAVAKEENLVAVVRTVSHVTLAKTASLTQR